MRIGCGWCLVIDRHSGGVVTTQVVMEWSSLIFANICKNEKNLLLNNHNNQNSNEAENNYYKNHYGCDSNSAVCAFPIFTANTTQLIRIIIMIVLLPNLCFGGVYEKKLLHHLLDTYNVLERPVANESDPLQLSFGLTLMQIIDVEWNDVNLRWNPSDFGGVKDLRIPPHRIWKPDVLMYNSADEGFDGTYPTNVVVKSNGSCLYVPPGIFKSTCKIDITWFPFDDQKCEMKFGSWTYDGFQLDLQMQDEKGGDLSSFITNGEWDLIGVPGKRNENFYTCCPEPYVDIVYVINIRRRTLYYFFNLIVPCVLIASMAVLGFTLPPDSGEKLSLGITILLSLTVFLNMVAETMPATSEAVPLLGVTILLSLSVFSLMIADALPQTSEAIPLLGTYFNCIMFMVASSVVSTILILNFHHRNADTHEMTSCVRVVFLSWLPCILRMKRPGQSVDASCSGAAAAIASAAACKNGGSPMSKLSTPLRDFEMKDRSSKSLLVNVLNMDDDFISSTGGGGGTGRAAATCFHHHQRFASCNTATSDHGGGHRIYAHDDCGINSRSITYLHRQNTTNNNDQIMTNTNRRNHQHCLAAAAGGGGHRELSLILRELRVITDKIKKDEEADEITNDWKFAAMVFDRLCLIIFTLFTIIATIGVLFSAPHVF